MELRTFLHPQVRANDQDQFMLVVVAFEGFHCCHFLVFVFGFVFVLFIVIATAAAATATTTTTTIPATATITNPLHHHLPIFFFIIIIIGSVRMDRDIVAIRPAPSRGAGALSGRWEGGRGGAEESQAGALADEVPGYPG